MIKKQLLILGLLISVFSSTVFAGGGWPLKKGQAYLKVAEWWTIADRHYTSQGLIDPNATIGLFNTTVYAEYGFTDRLTAIAYIPVYSRSIIYNQVSNTTGEIITPGDALNGIGDSDLGLKYGLTKPDSRIAVAATLKLGLPLGNEAGGIQGNLQTGDGEFNQVLRVDAGTGFNLGKKVNGYANAYAGFNNRTNDFSDEYRFGLEAGLGFLNKRIWAIGRLNIVESLKNGELSGETTSNSVFANNSEFTSFSGEVNFYITKKIGVSVGAATAIAGEIILADASYTVGVFLDLK